MKDILKAVVYAGLFAVPFLTLYVENNYFFPYITGKNFWFRIIVDVVFAAWFILALYEVKYRPKISGIVWSFGILLVVMFFANLLGLSPNTSFWSNFERMDGYVSLVHTFMYMLVLGSVIQTQKHWKYLLNTSLIVAFLVALYGLAQYGGMIDGASSRIDSRLGNAAYMAVYMLFHIFIALWLFVETRGTLQKFLYGALGAMFSFVLIETGTRGTAVGLAVGVMVTTAYIGLFGAKYREFRKYAVGGFVFLLLAVGAFVAGKDSQLIQSSPNLARIANISLDDLKIRTIIWGTAWEGVKERPMLGYGQSNFNYVFNKYYDPRLYAQEQWFDRSHDIFMDWLVTGGLIGLTVYLSIFGWCIYYLLIRPLREDDQSFTVMERGVLLGLLAGYFTHNLVVFDNIVSYIFFAIILGLINSRVGVIPAAVANFKVDKMLISQFATPVVAVVLVAGIYFFHVPGMQAAGDVIEAFRAKDPAVALVSFRSAINRNSFAHQEITEQFTQQAMSMARNQQVTPAIRDAYAAAAEIELMRLEEEKPGDARIEVFIGSYYRSINQLDKAAEHMALARTFSPLKQSIIVQQGFVALSLGKNEEARDFFKVAYELDQRNLEAREYYAASLFYTKEIDAALALAHSDIETVTDEAIKLRFAKSDFLIGAANQAGQTAFVADLFSYRINTEPDASQKWRTDAQNWASLAFLYYQLGEKDKAVSTLTEAQDLIPSFASSSKCFVKNIENNREPQTGCN
ncbi:MAG: hypothetical protein RLZZ230_89 [Candidatus Parcubacteria bacterium]|jgi:O-antigen ligase/tetratricopeptide (TPR) repeat protein